MRAPVLEPSIIDPTGLDDQVARLGKYRQRPLPRTGLNEVKPSDNRAIGDLLWITWNLELSPGP